MCHTMDTCLPLNADPGYCVTVRCSPKGCRTAERNASLSIKNITLSEALEQIFMNTTLGMSGDSNFL